MSGGKINRRFFCIVMTACIFLLFSFYAFCEAVISPVAVPASQAANVGLFGDKAMYVSKAPVKDYGKITGEIISVKVKQKNNPGIPLYAKIRLIKVISIIHDKRATCYVSLKDGDAIDCMFIQRESEKTGAKSADRQMEKGDMITADISGCPKECGCGNGWVLNTYQILK